MKKWSWLVAPAIVIALAAMPAHAAKKPASGGSGSSITIATINGVSTAKAATVSPTPARGDAVTFATTAAGLAGWEYPMVEVWCYQGSTEVWMDLDKPATQFLLGGAGSLWFANGGGASCTATLDAYGWRGGQESIRKLDSYDFTATG